MSFVRNYSDNQSPGDADSGIDSRGKITQISNQDINPKVADSFVRNFSDNQSPGDGDAPNAAISEEPGRLFGASEPFTGRAVAEEAAQKLTPSGKGGRDWIEESEYDGAHRR